MAKIINLKILALFFVIASGLVAMEQKTGDDYMEEANKILNDDSVWRQVRGITGSEKDRVVECYEKAANQYKINKSWSPAGHAHFKAAEIQKDIQFSSSIATQSYESAADCFIKSDDSEKYNLSTTCLSKAIQINLDNDNFRNAGKLSEKLSTISELSQSIPEAISNLKKAVEYFEIDGKSNHSAANCLIKIGEFSVQNNNYAEAAQSFENAATKSSAKNEYYLRSKIDGLRVDACLCTALNDFVELKKKVIKYFDIEKYNKSREQTFLYELLRAIENYDVEALNSAAKNYLTSNNTWRGEIITKLIARIEEENIEF